VINFDFLGEEGRGKVPYPLADAHVRIYKVYRLLIVPTRASRYCSLLYNIWKLNLRLHPSQNFQF